MEIYTIGGYNEVGKNMTVIVTGNGEDAFIFDCGLFLPPIVELEEKERSYDEKKLRLIGALPNDSFLEAKGITKKIRAIIPSHAHLDHIGAIPYVAYKYNAEIIGTPFTIEILKQLYFDNNIQIKNKITTIQPNSSYYVQGKKKKYKLDFVNITHSTIQTSMVALHTDEGIVLYANDFKFDNNPIVGKEPNYDMLKQLAKEGVRVLIVDSLYSKDERKTASEKVARSLLEDVMLTTSNEKSAIVVTTFSSHIARLKSIVDFSKRLGRQPVFVGRSLNKYVRAAMNVKLCPFAKDIHLSSFKNQIEKSLKKINSNKTNYVLVCTGHQGEPGSIMDRISKSQLPFNLDFEDHVIFSSSVIPTKINIENRKILEEKLKKKGVRIFNNVHSSVLPSTEVIINNHKGMKIKKIAEIDESEKSGLKVPAFDKDLKIKWFDAKLIEHPYKGKVFDIQTKSGRSATITSGHSLFKFEKGKIISEIGDNLKEDDYILVPKKFSWHNQLNEINIEDYLKIGNKHFEKNNGFLFYNKKQICPLKIKLNKEFARLLGYYLAEGCAPRHISLTINKSEQDILEEIKEYIKLCLGYNIHVYPKGTGALEINFGARILKSLFKKWFGNNAKTKKIPDFVFSTSKDFKLNFLGAYINGDGCIDKGKKHFRIRIKTASKKLASDLIYLFSQIGICAKFDHIEIGKRRKIAGNKNYTEETKSYVLRIKGEKCLNILKNFLSDKFKIQIEKNLRKRNYLIQQLPPESLPIKELDFSEIEPKKRTYLYDIKYYNQRCKKEKRHISPELLMSQAEKISGFTEKIINSDLLFDPIVKIDVSEYEGEVYDFKVPGAENFIGGFGGIILHNSGHAGREDLRDFINMIDSEHVIPAHGDKEKLLPMIELCNELGYKTAKDVHLMANGGHLIV
jgi:ribonuclease J